MKGRERESPHLRRRYGPVIITTFDSTAENTVAWVQPRWVEAEVTTDWATALGCTAEVENYQLATAAVAGN